MRFFVGKGGGADRQEMLAKKVLKVQMWPCMQTFSCIKLPNLYFIITYNLFVPIEQFFTTNAGFSLLKLTESAYSF